MYAACHCSPPALFSCPNDGHGDARSDPRSPTPSGGEQQQGKRWQTRVQATDDEEQRERIGTRKRLNERGKSGGEWRGGAIEVVSKGKKEGTQESLSLNGSESEAATVCSIFALYLQHMCLCVCVAQLGRKRERETETEETSDVAYKGWKKTKKQRQRIHSLYEELEQKADKIKGGREGHRRRKPRMESKGWT